MARLLPALALALAACEPGGEPVLYGKGDPAAIAREASPLASVRGVSGTKEVTVEGHVESVCQTMGCWFYLASEGDLLYVDLEQGKHFTVPPDARGRRAIASGTLHAQGGDRRLVPRAVLLWP